MSIGVAEAAADGSHPVYPPRNYAVYFNPSDFPGQFVVRGFIGVNGLAVPSNEHWTGPTIDAVRARLPTGLARLPRSPGDDPVIVETWV